MESVSESTTSRVLRRSRRRPATAMLQGVSLPVFLEAPGTLDTPVWRTASMGDTFAARRQGRMQETQTVSSANSAPPTKITGLADSEKFSEKVEAPITAGTRNAPHA